MPHAQVSQNAPPELQRALADRALGLPSVSEAKSLVSVPGARAFVLAEEAALGPPGRSREGANSPTSIPSMTGAST